MYKLIAIDIDRTLLDSYDEISEENKKAIKEAQDRGIEVVLASGRLPNSVIEISKEINANNYLIAGNGVTVMNIAENKPIYENFIPKEKALKMIRLCDENNMFYNVYTQDIIVTKELNYNVKVYHHKNESKPETEQTKIKVVDDIYRYIDEVNESSISKICICDLEEEKITNINKKLEKDIGGLYIIQAEHKARKIIVPGKGHIDMNYHYSEITNENVNKWDAIKKLAEILNIETEEIVTIGDSINDEEMVKNAGLGIAMGGSILSLKNVGKKSTKSNDENGVAYAIREYVLK